MVQNDSKAMERENMKISTEGWRVVAECNENRMNNERKEPKLIYPFSPVDIYSFVLNSEKASGDYFREVKRLPFR